MVAGKACELDKNVPYLNRYQRYADKSFSQSDYEAAERLIFESLGFDLQLSTFIPFLDFYLSRGVLSPSEATENLKSGVEAEAAVLSKEFIRKGNFSKYSPELLALSIIRQAREKLELTPWTAELETLSGKSGEEVPVFVPADEPILKERTNSHNNACFSSVKIGGEKAEHKK